MAGISFSGISSGLDTKTIIDQLMSVEANPQVLLQQKLTKQNAVVSALQGVNTRLASLATGAAALAAPGAWDKASATSSSGSVTVSAGATAQGALTFDVTQLAEKASAASAPVADAPLPHTPRTFTIHGTAPSFQPITVTAASGNVADMARAINAAGGEVTATAVPTGDGSYRLVVTAKLGGANTLSTSGADAPALTQLRAGQDAKVALGGGIEVTSSSNTFADLMTGVSVTVSMVEQGVTISAAPDTSAVARQVAGVVGSLNVVLSEIADQTRSTTTGRGPLAGSSLLRGLQQQLADTTLTGASGATLSDLGVQLSRGGAVTIDQAVFTAYAIKEPVKARALVAAFAGALGTVATGASDGGTGLVSQAVTSGQSAVKDLDARIDGWDARLELRRAALERQFAALEVALDRNKSQSSWLSGALSGLSSSS